MATVTDFELLEALTRLRRLNLTTSLAADQFAALQRLRVETERAIADARRFCQRQGFSDAEAALDSLAARLT